MFLSHTVVRPNEVAYDIWRQGGNNDVIMLRTNQMDGLQIVVYLKIENEEFLFYFSEFEITSDHSIVFEILHNHDNITLVPRYLDGSCWDDTFENEDWHVLILQNMLGEYVRCWFGLTMNVNAVEDVYQPLHQRYVQHISEIINNAINYYDTHCVNEGTYILHNHNIVHGQAP